MVSFRFLDRRARSLTFCTGFPVIVKRIRSRVAKSGPGIFTRFPVLKRDGLVYLSSNLPLNPALPTTVISTALRKSAL